MGLQVGVTRVKHCGKSSNLHLASALLARLLEMAVIPNFFQDAFAVDPLLQSTQRFFYRFAFFKSDLSQYNSLPLQFISRGGQ
jgi:hypothetical protein